MTKKVSNDIAIQVETQYQPEHSSPLNNKYLFAYRITITNDNPFTVQLLKRKWFIFDAIGHNEVVEGQGVVGQQPILKTGETYSYYSACPLRSPMGKMHGEYTLQRLDTEEELTAEVPEFVMVATERLN